MIVQDDIDSINAELSRAAPSLKLEVDLKNLRAVITEGGSWRWALQIIPAGPDTADRLRQSVMRFAKSHAKP